MDTTLGWMFVALAALFALALVPRLAVRFYPARPGVGTRSAAPVIFSLLAGACFSGFDMPALVAVVLLGSAQIITSRRKAKRRPLRCGLIRKHTAARLSLAARTERAASSGSRKWIDGAEENSFGGGVAGRAQPGTCNEPTHSASFSRPPPKPCPTYQWRV